LRHSYKLGFEEALNSLSGLRVGVDMGLFNTIDIKQVNELFIGIGAAHLRKMFPEAVSAEEIDISRAALCREKLRQIS
jgi:protein arginine kinase